MANEKNLDEEVKKEIAGEIGRQIAKHFSTGKIIQGEMMEVQPLPIDIRFSNAPAALALHDEVPTVLSGVLESPAEWAERRGELHDGKKAHLIVDREKMNVILRTDERNHFADVITGVLKFHPAFILFGINSGAYITPNELADKIKMNRSFFETKAAAMQLVAELKGFKAKVAKEIEKQNDNRGNAKDLKEQVVTTNIPASFKLHMPIFKGQPAKTFECEIYIDADDLTCTLVSPEANDEIEHLRDTAINAVIDRVKTALPGIAVMER